MNAGEYLELVEGARDALREVLVNSEPGSGAQLHSAFSTLKTMSEDDELTTLPAAGVLRQLDALAAGPQTDGQAPAPAESPAPDVSHEDRPGLIALTGAEIDEILETAVHMASGPAESLGSATRHADFIAVAAIATRHAAFMEIVSGGYLATDEDSLDVLDEVIKYQAELLTETEHPDDRASAARSLKLLEGIVVRARAADPAPPCASCATPGATFTGAPHGALWCERCALYHAGESAGEASAISEALAFLGLVARMRGLTAAESALAVTSGHEHSSTDIPDIPTIERLEIRSRHWADHLHRTSTDSNTSAPERMMR